MKLITTFAIASGSYLFFSMLSKKYVNQVLRNKRDYYYSYYYIATFGASFFQPKAF